MRALTHSQPTTKKQPKTVHVMRPELHVRFDECLAQLLREQQNDGSDFIETTVMIATWRGKRKQLMQLHLKLTKDSFGFIDTGYGEVELKVES